jgi:predicted tellurium resistance membrane protein TerC
MPCGTILLRGWLFPYATNEKPICIIIAPQFNGLANITVFIHKIITTEFNMFNFLPTLLVDLTLPNFASVDVWLSIITLTFLEIVLGVDNIIFVSIVANQLPKAEQPKARNYGLILALVFRLVLLLFIGFILSLDKPIFEVPFIKEQGEAVGLSIKDIILLLGGIFLIYKSTQEIGEKLEGHETDAEKAANTTLFGVILQICIVNIVFSFDSILTAMGMTSEVVVMMIAVIISILVMMAFSGPISTFINQHPTMQMLALSFLILIGVMLVAEAFHQHVSKGYIYFAIAFSMGVEILNMRMRKANRKTVKLNSVHQERADLKASDK